MKKVRADISNDFCPQTLFLYGTYKEDGTPNFGLFCWFSYLCDNGLGVMACIGGDKLTKDRIRETKVFSANLVTEGLLPLADYYGSTDGYQAEKMNVMPEIISGEVLDVPIIQDSPWSFELEVRQEINTNDGTVFLCTIKNVLAFDFLVSGTESIEERLRRIAPVSTTCSTYFSYDGKAIGGWGELKKRL